jgi:hypothetical protein
MQKRLNALGTITEAIHVLGQILPKLRTLPKASPDALRSIEHALVGYP